MSLWLHELAEADHRILNPFSDQKLRLLGEVCRLAPGTTVLDLACGKGELLCLWAQEYGVTGHGVDLSEVFLDAAARRAAELGVTDRVSLTHGDAAEYRPETRYDIVSCLGATWIGDGLLGTVELMRQWVEPDGLLLVGEPYWIDPPPAKAREAYARYRITDLAGVLDRVEAAGCELVEMVMASPDDWDRYVASQWWTLTEWLRRHPDDPRAAQVRAFRDSARRDYLAHDRRYLGWGVFVLRP